MSQSTALTEQEQKELVLLDEDFNPQADQDIEIAKMNFLSQQRMRQYLMDSEEPNKLEKGIVRAVNLNHKLINQPKILETNGHENASPSKKVGIVFEGEEGVIFHGRLVKDNYSKNEEIKVDLQSKNRNDDKELNNCMAQIEVCRPQSEIGSSQSPNVSSSSFQFAKKRMNSIEEAVKEIVRIKRPQGSGNSVQIIIKKSGEINSQNGGVRRFGSWKEGSQEFSNSRQEDFGLNVLASREEILIQDSDSNSVLSDF